MKRPLEHLRPSMTLVMASGLIGFMAWASWFEIDQTVRATGQIIPGTRTQIIQTADGGVLSEILVHEGQVVQAGERLALLEKDRSHAAYSETQAKVASVQTALVRAHAEAQQRPPVFAPALQRYPQFIQAQMAHYQQRRQTLDDELQAQRLALKLALEEHQLNLNLFKTGDVSKVEVLRTQRQVSEIESRLQAILNKYQQEARQEVIRLEDELSSHQYKLEERQSVLEHTELTTPTAGIVKYLKVNTVGGVLRAGDELMQISPTDSDMVIEAKVNPADIGQLHTGLPVAIKFDAFDYSTYGTLQGVLTYISSDTLNETSPTGVSTSYYRAHVQLSPTTAHAKLRTDMLKNGMTASIDIQTRRRSIMSYLTKPLHKAFGGALNER